MSRPSDAYEPMTESVRRRVGETVRCPTCGQPKSDGGVRALAADIGVGHSVLWRLLRGGDMTGRNLDRLVAWLDTRPEPE